LLDARYPSIDPNVINKAGEEAIEAYTESIRIGPGLVSILLFFPQNTGVCLPFDVHFHRVEEDLEAVGSEVHLPGTRGAGTNIVRWKRAGAE